MAEYKIYKIAKELNQASTVIIDFLNGMGQETPKGHMSTVSEDVYQEVLKKFNRSRWQALQDQEQVDKVQDKRKQAERAREQELEKILAQTAEVIPEVEQPAAETPAEEPPVTVIEVLPPEDLEQVAATEAVPEPAPEPAPEPVETPVPEALPEPVESEPPIEVVAHEAPAGAPPAEAPVEAVTAQAAAPPAPEPEPVEEKPAAPAGPAPGTVEAMMQEAKREETLARARQLVKEREKGTTQPPAETAEPAGHKRRLKRRKEDSPEEQAIRKAVERAQRAAKDRKKVVPPPAPGAAPVTAPPPAAKPSGKRRRGKKQKIDQRVIDASIKQTLASMEEKRPRKRHRRVQEGGEVLMDDHSLRVTEFISTNELAQLLDVPVIELIKKCLDMGLQVTINQRLDRDIIELLSGEYGYDVQFQSEFEGTEEAEEEEVEVAEELQPRPPVVTIMGHVDHGKTSLLDFLRKSSIAAGESGGITQHIGAYSLEYNDRPITFLDTPGHEAFTAMRARGAQVTDLVVLVVAADDHVMPQTIEAINHAKAAGVPIVIAINKMDKPTADADRVRRELADQGILVEEWGGKYQSALISAKKGDGVEKLLEEILLAADVLDLQANPDRKARGIIIESRLDRGRGPLATVLIQKGTLGVGDIFVAGASAGRVKAMLDEFGQKLKVVKPGFPVQVLGFDGTPQAGDTFLCMESEKDVKAISLRRQALQREQAFKQIRALTLEGLSQRIKAGESRELPLIIKGDVNGSVEALSDSLMKLNAEEVSVKLIHRGVGAITETDVNLAAASGALIIGFMVHPNLKARELANRENVEIRIYRIIYDVINDVKSALEGLLAPTLSEKHIGTAEVRQVFKVSKVGTIAGCYVQQGKIERSNRVRLIRDGQQVYEGLIASLRRFKDDVREVAEGFECGIGIANFNDLKEGDSIEAFQVVETRRTLA
ncbi:MAG: translation initiation factor IF-2 [Candidatus Zixiibacteriota bacterium]|nr:MAG: translation initiation factor IF-2 [candidate division Zixibacteria bacterium]